MISARPLSKFIWSATAVRFNGREAAGNSHVERTPKEQVFCATVPPPLEYLRLMSSLFLRMSEAQSPEAVERENELLWSATCALFGVGHEISFSQIALERSLACISVRKMACCEHHICFL